MSSLAHPHSFRRRTTRRQMIAMFTPLALLVCAALIANAGGRVAADANAANSVTVTATVVSDRHITSTCGTAGTDGTIAFGSVNAATAYDNNAAPCNILFGATNSSAALQINGSATNLGWTGFSVAGTTCAAATAGQIGIRADSAGSATEVAPYNCADGQVVDIPTSAENLCTATAGADVSCALVVGFHTGAVATGAKTGVLTTTLA